MAARGEIRMESFYRQIDVWAQVDAESVVCYRCFEVLPLGKFCVQSKDYFYIPLTEKQLLHSAKQFAELFAEIRPDKRSKLYATIEEAVAAHNKIFS
jgi:hypothetical protein